MPRKQTRLHVCGETRHRQGLQCQTTGAILTEKHLDGKGFSRRNRKILQKADDDDKNYAMRSDVEDGDGF